MIIRQLGRGTFVASVLGEKPENGRTGSFLSLLPPPGAGEARRTTLVQDIAAHLTADGHRFDSVVVDPVPETGALPLSAWKPILRHNTTGLLCYPRDLLSQPSGRLSDECIAEAFRRHVPVVAIGGKGGSAKLNAVIPDYMGAGFSLTGHLLQIGCEHVVVLRDARADGEANLVVDGCRGAAMRIGRKISETMLSPDLPGNGHPGPLDRLLEQLATGQRGTEDRPVLGLVCVGPCALGIAQSNPRVQRLREAGSVAVACVLEPGDSSAAAAGITSYEVDIEQIASWGAQLLLDARPDQRPIEIVVPGRLCIRNTSRC